MKRLDDGKVSLVDFLQSIKFAQQKEAVNGSYGSTRFSHFYPQARCSGQGSGEDSHLIRSAN